MPQFDAVLFDFDGTVADTGEGVFFSVRYSIDKFGLKQPSDEEIRTFIGPPLVTSYSYFYPELSSEEISAVIAAFREKYAEFGRFKFRIYDGITELLKYLSENGIKTAVASSKPQDFLEQIIHTAEIDKYFDRIIGASRSYASADKEDIINEAIERLGVSDRSRILMVGDRKFDIDGAKKAGIPCAAVLFGYGSQKEFEEHHAEYIVKDCDDIKKIIFEEK